MDYTAVLASSGIDVIAIEAKAGMFQTTFQKLKEKGLEIRTSYVLLANLVNCAHTLTIKLSLSNLLDSCYTSSLVRANERTCSPVCRRLGGKS
jgi:hypothetical protein